VQKTTAVLGHHKIRNVFSSVCPVDGLLVGRGLLIGLGLLVGLLVHGRRRGYIWLARGEADCAASDANLSKGKAVVVLVRRSSKNHGAADEGLGAGEIGIGVNVDL
jgi:hypothetical protein